MPLKITDELTEVVLRAKAENPELNISQLARKLKKSYGISYAFDSLRKAVVKILTKKKENKIDIDFDNDEFDIVLPDSKAVDRPFHKIYGKRILILSDTHIPYHDNSPLKLALKTAWDFGIDTILLNGDIIDFYPMSKFARDPNQRDVFEELRTCEIFLQQVKHKFNNCKIIFKEGNHEYRLRKYIYEKAPELVNIPELALPSLLHFSKYQIDFVDAWTVMQAGKLNIIHGHEILGGGINVARTQVLKSLDNILFGHFHRHQDYTQRTIADKVVGGWAIGCLSHLKPDYYPVNNYIHGFALVNVDEQGFFEVHNKKIINNYVK